MVRSITALDSIYCTPNSIYKPVTAANAPNTVLNSVNNLDEKVLKNAEKVLYTTGLICPSTRRISSLPQSIKEKDNTRAGLLTGLAVANFPRDYEEVKFAVKEGKNIFTEGLNGIKYQGQHNTTFFKNTLMQPINRKFPWLDKWDKTAYNTSFGKLTRKALNINEITNTVLENGKYIEKSLFTGKYISKLAGTTLKRIPVIGVVATGLLEAPKLIKSVTNTEGTGKDKAKAFTKQFIKSTAYVGLITLGIAIGGAALIPAGYIAALLGMGIGNIAALEASKTFNKAVDKVIT